MQYTWNGGNGSYTDATNWVPQGVPLWDDDASALIQSGTVTLSNTEPNAVNITLSGASETVQPNLVLDNAALGPRVFLGLVPPSTDGFPGLGFATITVDGFDTNEGSISLGGQRTSPDFLTVAIAPYGQLNQEGTIGVFGSSQLRVHGTGQAPATLNNNGTINIGGGLATISADLIGSGTIAFVAEPTGSGSVEFGEAVAATQHIAFSSVSSAQVRIDDPSAFHGILDGFQATPIGAPGFHTVTLANTQATGTYFAQITPDAGALLVLNGQEVVAALTVTGTHASNYFNAVNNSDGSTTVR